MFDIAWSEFLVVAVVALVVVGPRDLPALLRTVGKTVASLRRMAGEFQSQFHEAMREAELDDLKNEVTGLKDKASKFVGASPFEIARNEIRNAIDAKPSALAGDAAKVDAEAPSALAPSTETSQPDTAQPDTSRPETAPPDPEPAPRGETDAAARAAAAREAAAKGPAPSAEPPRPDADKGAPGAAA